MSVLTLQTSMLFDIRLGGDFDGQITYFQPVLAPLPLEQAVFEAGKPCSELIGHFFWKITTCFCCTIGCTGWKICGFDAYCLKFVSLWFYFLEEKDSTGAVKKKRVLCEMCIQKQTHAMRIFAISLILREIREDSKFWAQLLDKGLCYLLLNWDKEKTPRPSQGFVHQTSGFCR